jgi:aminoglycoside phosphotransferase (APT) family kinase protein
MSWDWDAASLAAVSGFLSGQGLLEGTLTPRRIGDGHSNLTYLVGANPGLVLRRPPPPPLPKGAHDVLREVQVLRALEGSGVPVPRVRAVAEAGAVLDVPFYVMDQVQGQVISEALPSGVPPEHRRAMAFALADGLAALHAVDWRARGLAGFGNPEGFNARHLRRLHGVMMARDNGLPAGFQPMHDWLSAHVPPESDTAIVHNDYRLGNVMWAPGLPPRLAAVLDWELATLGDPLLDVGYMVVCYPDAAHDLTPTMQLSGAFLAPGFPTLAEMLGRYAQTSGRDLSGLRWYGVMAAWKMAVLYDFSHRQGKDSYYADPEQSQRFIAMAERIRDHGITD